ncbi:ATP-binding protein [Crenobacter luteus]|uniref:histidine kinase n=1 Tax=Crenobacter luteus TaxID=1452487 RepID=A0A161SBQ8_9NEIS|nr:ATP-binding protein [Crenobacter luteus]KZE33453.1 hypothetical protein AVW16_07875 [Crenobacter luteus]
MSPSSLRARLLRPVFVLVPLTWVLALTATYQQTRHEIAEIFDTEQALFARQLLAVGASLDGDAAAPPPLDALLANGDGGDYENDALGFVVRDRDGRVLLADGEGHAFPPAAGRVGFADEHVGDARWRLFFLASLDGRHAVAVGQPQSFRDEVLWEVLASQSLPWLLALPLLLAGIAFAVRRGLAPLAGLADELGRRRPDDSGPLTSAVPDEARPLTDALESLFVRVADTLARERRFTADAAHELRTPLAALRVQAEVAGLADDAETRARALGQLMVGIDRATRLTEQLLALSRLDPLEGLPRDAPLDWGAIVRDARDAVEPQRVECGARIDVEPGAAGPVAHGDAVLITLLLRNLLDNALRYGCGGRDGGRVTLSVAPDAVTVRDDGPGVAGEHMQRLGERFFRPPGQRAGGSGLGLSIAQRVARLHGLKLVLANRPGGGFEARLARCDTLPHSRATAEALH